jgi:wyosine [tRNA(Phe)-imidazoG37] synthetase (radical SAM superfamily)
VIQHLSHAPVEVENTKTFLFDRIIFGPVKSRRLGLSLGINLLPVDSKLCNFNCIYCECGWTDLRNAPKTIFQPGEVVLKKLENAFIRLKKEDVIPDTITFAGNGEPTMHPEFLEIIKGTILLRNSFFAKAKIAVLSNALMLNNSSVVEALELADLRILKLDAGTEDLFQKINQPVARRSLRWIVDKLNIFKGNLIIQTIFLKGEYQGMSVDNTTDEAINNWIDLIREIHPKTVMLYSLDRATPAKKLERVPVSRLFEIAKHIERIGIEAIVR